MAQKISRERKTEKAPSAIPTLEEMVRAGVHFGHRTTKWNPKMASFILGAKNNVHILDLEKTSQKLREAIDFLQKLVAGGGIVLFVGTTPAAKKVIEEVVLESKMPYVFERWLGGTLTNFKIMIKRISYFRDLEKKRESGELKKYTKKEQHEFNEELKKLERKFGGIKGLTKKPDALFVLDPKKNYLAIKEAKMAKIKTVALCDTNVDPTDIDYPIPANDDALSSLKLITEAVARAIEEGRKSIKSEARQPKAGPPLAENPKSLPCRQAGETNLKF